MAQLAERSPGVQEAGFILQHSINWILWKMLIIPEFRRFGQEEQEFKVVFGYIRNFKVAQGL